MKTSLMWHDCYFKHLDIPADWKNGDVENVQGRQDAFWVICDSDEIAEHVLPMIKDAKHKKLIETQMRKGFDQAFLISRSGFVQYYPYLSLYQGSLFEKIDEVYFTSMKQLRMLCKELVEVGDI